MRCNAATDPRLWQIPRKAARRHSTYAVVGSGPAGFFTAQRLVKALPEARIDVYEALPVPYGLVRFGVAPDHPEVKNVMRRFDELVERARPRVRFAGNVRLGRDVHLSELQAAYSGVVLAYGASRDRSLGLAREFELANILSARALVGWYNGAPEHAQLPVDLGAHSTALVVGNGNVALDVARLLLSPPDALAQTDMTSHAVRALRSSTVECVRILGRRGPLQAAFTAKELREMLQLPGVRVHVDGALVEREMAAHAAELARDRPRRRLAELLLRAAAGTGGPAATRHLHLDFLQIPVAFFSKKENPAAVGGLTVAETELVPLEQTGPASAIASAQARPTGLTRRVDGTLIVKSIGYQSVAVPGLPFDARRHVVPNEQGRVLDPAAGSVRVPGLYVSGWLKRGPAGAIADTMHDAYETAESVAADAQGDLADRPGLDTIKPLLESRGVQVVSFDDWKRLEAEEERRGALLGKPREKVVAIEEMLSEISRSAKSVP